MVQKSCWYDSQVGGQSLWKDCDYSFRSPYWANGIQLWYWKCISFLILCSSAVKLVTFCLKHLIYAFVSLRTHSWRAQSALIGSWWVKYICGPTRLHVFHGEMFSNWNVSARFSLKQTKTESSFQSVRAWKWIRSVLFEHKSKELFPVKSAPKDAHDDSEARNLHLLSGLCVFVCLRFSYCFGTFSGKKNRTSSPHGVQSSSQWDKTSFLGSGLEVKCELKLY